MRHTLSRRQFLKAAGMTTATACAAGLFSACGSGSASSNGGGASADTSSYTILYSSQPATLNYLTTATDIEMVVGANCIDTLVEYDNKGVMREGLATEWEFDEASLTWTFHLRDENWVEHTEEFEGTPARIIQHEYDHLEGMLFTDHLSPLKKSLLKRKLNHISAGKFKIDYRFVLPK